MNFFAKLTELFFPKIEESPKEVEKPIVTISEEAEEIIKAVENQQLKELSEKVYILAVNINNLILAQKQQQEFLVQIATLQEELLNQLDQGKIMFVKQHQPFSTGGPGDKASKQQQDENPFSFPDIPGKRKQNSN
jgi:hypothetical protein